MVTRRERVTALGWLAAGAGLLLWLKSPWRPFLPPCVFRQATGHLCPGCGSTRMVESLLAGDLQQAFLFNPLAFLCLPLVFWVILRWCALAFGRRLREPRSPTWAFPALPILIVAYWIARNFVDNPAQDP